MNSISRTHASAIEPFTLHPNPDSIRYVVGKFLFKFSVLVIHQDFETTNMVEEKLYRMESTRKYDIMKRYCPALNQANYLRIEFEMYVGKEVRDFMAKRSEYLSLILKVAQEQEE
ncbi:hypothetical protein OUZ56_009837 [Daphnia magna]|uniref:DUF5889 domain-containing protein n=1 Tax=Daphnia magna TaxID=35525 RepID=A0ABR0AHA6_9CRUS|nr:hypothetical protein OUZ56_009837 [Daphnia magna]